MKKLLTFLVLAQITFLNGAEDVPEPEVAPVAKFLSPGIVGIKNGELLGSDHLFNVTPRITVDVEISKPENEQIDINRLQVQQIIEKTFQEGRITPQGDRTEIGTEMPLFHFLVIIYPIKDGYAAYVDGRLLESVELKRVYLDPSTLFQAITWEDQRLMVMSKKDLQKEVDSVAQEIASNFIQRFQYFEGFKKRS